MKFLSSSRIFRDTVHTLSERLEYHGPLKAVAMEERPPAVVSSELSCLSSQSIYSGWLVFIFSSKCVVRRLKMMGKVLVQQNDTAVHTVISVKGSIETCRGSVSVIWWIWWIWWMMTVRSLHLCLLSNSFWVNTPLRCSWYIFNPFCSSLGAVEELEDAIGNEDVTSAVPIIRGRGEACFRIQEAAAETDGKEERWCVI